MRPQCSASGSWVPNRIFPDVPALRKRCSGSTPEGRPDTRTRASKSTVSRPTSGGAYGRALVHDFAISFLRSHRDRPFLLSYPMTLVHSPFQPPPNIGDSNPDARGEGNNNPCYFADMVAYMDRLVGGLDAELAALGLRLPTICEVAGIPVPSGLDGVSLLPQVSRETGRPREWLYAW
ncbi:MAG: sulfatase-like hydrolase/transferase [Kiritimatiellae bacterium]|nr:sulfatase-like hydrolase/transferase [Kiritimatiellia bacterium]